MTPETMLEDVTRPIDVLDGTDYDLEQPRLAAERQQTQELLQYRPDLFESLSRFVTDTPERVLELYHTLQQKSQVLPFAEATRATTLMAQLKETVALLGFHLDDNLPQEVSRFRIESEQYPYTEVQVPLEKVFQTIELVEGEDSALFWKVTFKTADLHDYQSIPLTEGTDTEENRKKLKMLREVSNMVTQYKTMGVENMGYVVWHAATLESVQAFQDRVGMQTKLTRDQIDDPAAFAQSIGMETFLQKDRVFCYHGWAGAPSAYTEHIQQQLSQNDKLTYIAVAGMGCDIDPKADTYQSGISSAEMMSILDLPEERMSLDGYASAMEHNLLLMGGLGDKNARVQVMGWSMGGEAAERLAYQIALSDRRIVETHDDEGNRIKNDELLRLYGLSDYPDGNTIDQVRAPVTILSLAPAKSMACDFVRLLYPEMNAEQVGEIVERLYNKSMVEIGKIIYGTPLSRARLITFFSDEIVAWFARNLMNDKHTAVKESALDHATVVMRIPHTVARMTRELVKSPEPTLTDDHLKAIQSNTVKLIRVMAQDDKLVDPARSKDQCRIEAVQGLKPITVEVAGGHHALYSPDLTHMPHDIIRDLPTATFIRYKAWFDRLVTDGSLSSGAERLSSRRQMQQNNQFKVFDQLHNDFKTHVADDPHQAELLALFDYMAKQNVVDLFEPPPARKRRQLIKTLKQRQPIMARLAGRLNL